jgi:putative ABC transport system permease protein
LTGFLVLIGSAASGEHARRYEAAILKTLGATRSEILKSFALRSVLMGAGAGLVALLAGGLGGWAVMTFVMDSEFTLIWSTAFAVILGGIIANVLAGLFFALRALNSKPSAILRTRE